MAYSVGMRIVSLLASGTEIVCALGAGNSLVGRSHECDHPSWVKALPCCSHPAFDVSISSGAIDAEVRRRIRAHEPLYMIHDDLIRQLAPDLVIAQEHCEVCAVTPGNVEQTCPAIRLLALKAGSLEGIFQDIVAVATALEMPNEGEALVLQQRRRLENVSARTSGKRRPSVVMLEWTDPLFAMGNWGPELVEIANGDLLLGAKGEYSRAIPADQLRAADPEYLIVAPCGFGLERALREKAVLQALPWWNELRAVKAGQVAFADGNLFFNRSGMSISQTAEIIAEILHGVTFGQPTKGVHWAPVTQ